jgi:tetratricopeptide (TPR) repeat protein
MHRWLYVLVPLVLLLPLAAAPIDEPTPDELIRQANAAFARNDLAEADRLYEAALARTQDPGLVAFNRAAVLFHTEAFREAELQYTLVLEDAACPPERAARAWYNRGTCLLRRGTSAAVYRSAIACFEHCLNSPAADPPLKADARHNLELAKLLWQQARAAANRPEVPNENPPPEEAPRPQSPPPASGTDHQPGGGMPDQVPSGLPTGSPVVQQPGTEVTPPTTLQPNRGGSGQHLQPLENDTQIQRLNPDDTREYLRRAAERLKKDRHDLWRTLYGKVAAGIRDW